MLTSLVLLDSRLPSLLLLASLPLLATSALFASLILPLLTSLVLIASQLVTNIAHVAATARSFCSLRIAVSSSDRVAASDCSTRFVTNIAHVAASARCFCSLRIAVSSSDRVAASDCSTPFVTIFALFPSLSLPLIASRRVSCASLFLVLFVTSHCEAATPFAFCSRIVLYLAFFSFFDLLSGSDFLFLDVRSSDFTSLKCQSHSQSHVCPSVFILQILPPVRRHAHSESSCSITSILSPVAMN
jgi:hypothetical protein